MMAITSSLRPIVGWCLMAVGVLHTLVGSSSQWPRIKAGLAEGGIGTWGSSAETASAYWFLVAGAALILLGGAVAALERHERALPRGVLAGLATLTIGGVLTMPASGFWFLTIPLALALLRRRSQAGPPVSAG
ncbi:DUF6463 family protein [Actinomyces timonensis]|uniref:DUF6463 family protein n=1 Tax=Actinomyces timonensis TaxID=1288391 RepID=A0AAU8N1H9_9ACTO